MKAVLLVRLDDQTLYIYSSCFYIEIIPVPNIVTVFGYMVGLSEKEMMPVVWKYDFVQMAFSSKLAS